MAWGVSIAYGVCRSLRRKFELCSKSHRKLLDEGSEPRRFFYLFGVCVCVCFCLFYFVIRITVDYVQNKLLLEEREEGWTQVEAEGPLGDKK